MAEERTSSPHVPFLAPTAAYAGVVTWTHPDERLLLLDSASLYFRAFFGVPQEATQRDGPPNNALRGFLDMLASLVERYRPTHLVACWDDDWRPAFRVDAIPTYKAHRVAEGGGPEREAVDPALEQQVPAIVDALAAVGIARVGAAGYEADDVIGSYAHRSTGVRPVDIVTGDRDLFQLVDDAHGIRVVYTARGGVRDSDLVDEGFLRTKYDVASGQAYADLATLRGDASDGLPGVAGIGEKTAARLLAAYGDLAGLRAAIDSGDPALKGAQRTRLEAASAYLDVAPKVVAVARDVPLPAIDIALPVRVADARLLSEVAATYGVASSLDRLLTALRID